MSDTQATPEGRRPLERFGPSGQVSGYAGLAIAAVTIGYVAVAVPTLTGLRVALGALLFAALTWALVLRPRVHVFREHLVLRNAFRDAHLPLAAVEHVTLGHQLTVWAAGEKYECLGVSRSGRKQLRAERRRAAAEHFSVGAGEALAAASAHDLAQETRVVSRLRELAQTARSEAGTGAAPPAEVWHTWAWPELAGVAVTAGLLAASLLVR